MCVAMWLVSEYLQKIGFCESQVSTLIQTSSFQSPSHWKQQFFFTIQGRQRNQKLEELLLAWFTCYLEQMVEEKIVD